MALEPPLKRSSLFPCFSKEMYPKTRRVLLFSYIKWRHMKSFNKIKQLIPSQVDLPTKSSPELHRLDIPPQKSVNSPRFAWCFRPTLWSPWRAPWRDVTNRMTSKVLVAETLNILTGCKLDLPPPPQLMISVTNQDDIRFFSYEIPKNIPKSLLKLQTSARTQASPGDPQF